MDSDKLNVGLIGAGRIGRLHAQHLSQRIADARLLMISDVHLESAQSCAKQYRVDQAVSDYHEILEHPDIGAVVICSPTDTHAKIMMDAAQHGKHIFCEKPIDHDLAKIDQALETVNKAGVLLQIGFNRRFDSNHRRIRDAVQNGEIGEPHLLHIVSRDPTPPSIEYIKSSGGLFLDMSIHDLDMARYVLGQEVEEVYAAGSVKIDPAIGEAGDLDTAVIMLKFSNGVMGTIDNSRQAVYGYDQRVEVFGSGGNVTSDNRYPNEVTVFGTQNIHRDLPHHFFMDRYIDSYVDEMSQFVAAVLTGQPSPLEGSAGRAAVVLALAAWKSYRENRPVRPDEVV